MQLLMTLSWRSLCRFFSRVPLPSNFPGDPHLKIPAKLKETFKVVRSDFEQRLRGEQGIVSIAAFIAVKFLYIIKLVVILVISFFNVFIFYQFFKKS